MLKSQDNDQQALIVAIKKAVECNHVTNLSNLLRYGSTEIPQDVPSPNEAFAFSPDTLLLLHNSDATDAQIDEAKLAADTALHAAAKHNAVDVVNFLLALESPGGVQLLSINLKNGKGDSALHVAVAEGHIGLIKLFLDAGADANAANMFNTTPIHTIDNNNVVDTLRLLLQHGADIHYRCDDGWSPLHSATDARNKDLVQHLVQFGASVDAVGLDGETPALYAAEDESDELLALYMDLPKHQRPELQRAYVVNSGKEDELTAPILTAHFKEDIQRAVGQRLTETATEDIIL